MWYWFRLQHGRNMKWYCTRNHTCSGLKQELCLRHKVEGWKPYACSRTVSPLWASLQASESELHEENQCIEESQGNILCVLHDVGQQQLYIQGLRLRAVTGRQVQISTGRCARRSESYVHPDSLFDCSREYCQRMPGVFATTKICRHERKRSRNRIIIPNEMTNLPQIP